MENNDISIDDSQIVESIYSLQVVNDNNIT